MNVPEYLIHKYVSLCNFKLLTKHKEGYNCRCEICGDSTSNKYKKRFWVLINRKYKGMVICFNCGHNQSFYSYLKEYKPYLFDEFKNELYGTLIKSKSLRFEKDFNVEVSEPEQKIVRCNLQNEFTKVNSSREAIDYCHSRLLPIEFINSLYYHENFMQWAFDKGLTYKKPSGTSDKRIIIPFIQKGVVTHIQARSIENSKMRYITLTLDSNYMKLWNIDNIDFTKRNYVFEGPIDASFIPNSFSTASSNFDYENLKQKYDLKNNVIILDNDIYNNTVLKKTALKYVKLGANVCIMPKEYLHLKDLNQMVLNRMKVYDIINIIEKNTFNGVKAEVIIKTLKGN